MEDRTKTTIHQNKKLPVVRNWDFIVRSGYDDSVDLTLYLTCVSLRLNWSQVRLLKPVLFPVTNRRNSAGGKLSEDLPAGQYKNS
jgi:hypothetical protein